MSTATAPRPTEAPGFDDRRLRFMELSTVVLGTVDAADAFEAVLAADLSTWSGPPLDAVE